MHLEKWKRVMYLWYPYRRVIALIWQDLARVSIYYSFDIYVIEFLSCIFLVIKISSYSTVIFLCVLSFIYLLFLSNYKYFHYMLVRTYQASKRPSTAETIKHAGVSHEIKWQALCSLVERLLLVRAPCRKAYVRTRTCRGDGRIERASSLAFLSAELNEWISIRSPSVPRNFNKPIGIMDWHARARGRTKPVGVGALARVESATYCLDPDSSRLEYTRGRTVRRAKFSKWTTTSDAGNVDA